MNRPLQRPNQTIPRRINFRVGLRAAMDNDTEVRKKGSEGEMRRCDDDKVDARTDGRYKRLREISGGML